MNWQSFIPYITALAAGGASTYFLGMEKKSGKRAFKDGMEPWACAVGGLLVGYVAGKFVQTRLSPTPPPPPQLRPPVTEQGLGEYLDLEMAPPRALPPPRPLHRPQPPTPDTRAAGRSDAELLQSNGIFEGSGEDGLGSYEQPEDVDDIDVQQLLKESGWGNGSNN